MSIDTSKMCFVFGSNESGYHGGGAAKFALNERGARWGHSYGYMEGPKNKNPEVIVSSFTIPTKSQGIKSTLKLWQIKMYIEGFLAFAYGHPEIQFQVTCIGCGLAGLQHEDVAPMFIDAPNNCLFDEKWRPWLHQYGHKFWGQG